MAWGDLRRDCLPAGNRPRQLQADELTAIKFIAAEADSAFRSELDLDLIDSGTGPAC